MVQPRVMKNLMRFGSVGLEFGVAVGVGTWLGVTADARLGSSPACTLAGLFLGLATGFVMLYKAVLEIQQASKDETARPR